jgi:putative exporter of polyketide antibiotics
MVRYPVSKTGGSSGLGGSTPSPSLPRKIAAFGGSIFRGAHVKRHRQSRHRRRERSGVVELVRRATVTREAQVRALPPELLLAPVVEWR